MALWAILIFHSILYLTAKQGPPAQYVQTSTGILRTIQLVRCDANQESLECW